MDDLLSLAVNPDEPLSAAKWNALVAAIASRTLQRGNKGVRLRRGPDATHVSFVGGKGGCGALPATSLRISIATNADGRQGVTLSQGFIGGYEPRINNVPVSTLDADGNPPLFLIDPAAIDPATGIGLLYARVTLNTDWSIQKVELEARSTPPSVTAWRAYKLLAFLRRTLADDPAGVLSPVQRVFFDLGHTSSQRGSGGLARHWFWAM